MGLNLTAMHGKLLGMNQNNKSISSEAVTALLNATANREGGIVSAAPLVLAELTAAGLIGAARGLTRKGWIRRNREAEALLDSLF